MSISNIGDNDLLNLFHGPTLAFKDYAMCLLAKIYEYYLKKLDRKLIVIGATAIPVLLHLVLKILKILVFYSALHNSTSLPKKTNDNEWR